MPPYPEKMKELMEILIQQIKSLDFKIAELHASESRIGVNECGDVIFKQAETPAISDKEFMEMIMRQIKSLDVNPDLSADKAGSYRDAELKTSESGKVLNTFDGIIFTLAKKPKTGLFFRQSLPQTRLPDGQEKSVTAMLKK